MLLQVNRTEIDVLAKELRLRLDEEKIAILSELESCDIQAGPGTGKTTMLTAKLALLAPKWTKADAGICVLSHTNVARREIESRMGQCAGLRRLLHYPHFVGTFQRFVDEFLALPYLRMKRLEITAIDDEKFAARAMALLAKGPYFNLRAVLQKRSEPPESVVGGLRFENAKLDVTHPAATHKGFPKSTTKTGQELTALKKTLTKAGYFRYDDMFAIAEASLVKLPYLIGILRRRFPWVFVDELQDMRDSQDRIVEQLFADPCCILQRFGDKNQAIFHLDNADVEAPKLFGRRKLLPLSLTHRFGDQIAHFASALTVVEPQILKGHQDWPQRNHTIFVFQKDSIERVVPSFANFVLQELTPAVCAGGKICVVGSRKNVPKASDNFPLSLGDYWKDYKSDLTRKIQSPDSFLGYIHEARNKSVEEKSLQEAFSLSMTGLLEFLRRAQVEGSQPLARSRTQFKELLSEQGLWLGVKGELWSLLRPDVSLSEVGWNASLDRLRRILAAYLPQVLSSEANGFIRWSDTLISIVPTDAGDVEKRENILVHRTNQGSIDVHFNTVHGVKGETHLATLVVETFMQKSHDIKAVLPVLTQQKSAAKLTGGAIGHCKRIFVGLTRPKELVCLAIYQEHVDDKSLRALEAAGWKIKVL